MLSEAPDQVLRIAQLDGVATKQQADCLRPEALAGALWSVEDDRCPWSLAGVLDRIGHPCRQPFIALLTAVADHVPSEVEERPNVSRLRRDPVARPEVQHPRRRLLTGQE